MKNPFVEIMKMFEILIIKVITKHDSSSLPYLSTIKILQSVYGCDKKTKLTRDRSRQEEVFCKIGIFKNLEKFKVKQL